jgi:hypothetical protein
VDEWDWAGCVFAGPFIRRAVVGRQADTVHKNAGERELGRVARKDEAAEWRGYVNVDLTPQQKEQFDDWTHTDEPWLVLEGSVSGGCTVSIKQDSNGAGYLACCTQRRAASVNAGYCLTARAHDPGKALLRLLFTLVCLGVDDEWILKGRVSDPDRW